MSQIKPEWVKGVVRNSDTTHTAVLKNGARVRLDESSSSSLLNRLDKDKSRIEREVSKPSRHQLRNDRRR